MCLPGDTDLVRQLHQRLLRSAPAAKVQTNFMGPTDLAQVQLMLKTALPGQRSCKLPVRVQQQVFRESVVVFHPPHYDAYGE